MGKFIPDKVREYKFDNLRELVDEVVKEYDRKLCKSNNNDDIFSIGFAVTIDEAKKLISTLLSTGEFDPMYLEFDNVDYRGEYHISIWSDGSFWVEKSWDDECNKYIPIEIDDIIFVSQDVSKVYFDTLNDGKNFIILYDIEE